MTLNFGGGNEQEGRASLNPDSRTLTLATNHRCAQGAVGSGGITINGSELGGDARQVYRY